MYVAHLKDKAVQRHCSRVKFSRRNPQSYRQVHRLVLHLCLSYSFLSNTDHLSGHPRELL